jgi:hypothetical protein
MVTDGPRSRSPDIELGAYTSQHLGRLGRGFVILRLVICMSTDVCSQPLPSLSLLEDTRSTL